MGTKKRTASSARAKRTAPASGAPEGVLNDMGELQDMNGKTFTGVTIRMTREEIKKIGARFWRRVRIVPVEDSDAR